VKRAVGRRPFRRVAGRVTVGCKDGAVFGNDTRRKTCTSNRSAAGPAPPMASGHLGRGRSKPGRGTPNSPGRAGQQRASGRAVFTSRSGNRQGSDRAKDRPPDTRTSSARDVRSRAQPRPSPLLWAETEPTQDNSSGWPKSGREKKNKRLSVVPGPLPLWMCASVSERRRGFRMPGVGDREREDALSGRVVGWK